MKQSVAIEALGALAHETRLSVFRLLVQAGPSGMPAGAIGGALEIPSPTLSFHLKELRHAGLIQAERIGRSQIYRTDYAAMSDLLMFLSEKCCEGVTEYAPKTRKVTV